MPSTAIIRDIAWNSDDICSTTIKLFWFGGFNPGLKPLWRNTLAALNITVCLLFFVLGIKGFQEYSQTSMFFKAECIQSCIHLIIVIVKVKLMYFRLPTIYALIVKTLQLWKIEAMDGEIRTDCLKILKMHKTFLNFYYCTALTASFIYYVRSYFTYQLPGVIYIPEGCFFYLAPLFAYFDYGIYMSTIAIDNIFFCLAALLMVQFKLLGHKLEHLFEETQTQHLQEELKLLVEYHNFLISYCQDLSETYSAIFLSQYLASIASGAIAAFIVMQPGPWMNRLKGLTFFSIEMMQIALFCFPAEFLTAAAKQVAVAVYNSNWSENGKNKYNKSFVLIEAAAQQTVGFNGHGMVWMNLKSFALVWKTAFSVYTFLNTTQNIKTTQN